MLTYDVEQGSDEWFEARLGIPTASEFDKIITAGGKVSTQAEAYAARLLAEILTGKPVQTFEKTPWMERGAELEEEAAQYYELQNELDLVKVGFCTDDNKLYGCSPDRLVGEEGLLEIKCPAPHTHVQYLLNGTIDKGYWPQIQGQLLVTGRQWCDWMSYNPEMPAVIIRMQRDEEFIGALKAALVLFRSKLDVDRALLISRGYLNGNS